MYYMLKAFPFQLLFRGGGGEISSQSLYFAAVKIGRYVTGMFKGAVNIPIKSFSIYLVSLVRVQ